MASDWQILTIQECASSDPYSTQIGPFGKAIMADMYTKSGIPVIRGTNVNHGRFNDDDFVFIDEKLADKLSKFESFPDDVLLVHKGTLGKIGIMPKRRKFPRYIMGNSMLRVRCNSEKLLPDYLYYWLTSPVGQQYLFSRVSQVGVPQIQTPLSTLRQAELLVPPIPEQLGITKVLGVIDDKIDLLRETNATLEAIAQALFKSWFVDFDPVRAKAEGRDPEGLPPEVADLFPSEFEDSELGAIPKGWQVGSLADVFDIQGGTQPPASEFVDQPQEGYVRLLQIRDFASDSHKTFIPHTKKLRMVEVDDVLIGRYGSGSGDQKKDSLGRLLRGLSGAINVAVVKTIPKIRNSREYISALVGSGLFYRFIVGGSARAVQAGFRQEDLAFHKVAIPPQWVFDSFESLASPIWEKRKAQDREVEALCDLRDTLLPRLMSGKLRILSAVT